MSESYPSQKYLQGEFEDLAGELEEKLAHAKKVDKKTEKDKEALNICDEELSTDIGVPSPIAKFVTNARKGCECIVKPAGNSVIKAAVPLDRNAEFLTELHKQVDKVKGTRSRQKEIDIADALKKDKRFKDLPIASDLLQFTQLKNLDEAVQLVMNQRSMQSTAREFFNRMGPITSFGAVSGNMPREEDWDKLKNEMEENIKKGVCGCSLIYSYWLDEGGLQFAIERIADRVENGIVPTTEALKMLHIRDSSLLVDIISSFIVTWQRGEMFDVDARRKQYQAQYGFPLYAAKAWGRLATGDPRSVFPAAFHRFLYEASRYFHAQRDRFKDPDIEATRSAIGQLLDALREGNENMRKKRTGQIRGQSEYCKRLLGGSQKNNPIADEWDRYLTGRPGITDASDAKIWQVKSDAVAAAYGWARPRIKDYTALAEKGETILVATRIGGEAAASDPGMAEAFAELMKPHILNYVNAFKIVGGVDLGRKLIVASPGTIMARNIRPPAIPPLKRHWGAVVPTANRSSAA